LGSFLGEALQTVMRKYQIPKPYEKLKELTRGKNIDRETLDNFISGLNLPDEVKKKLKQLTPDSYLGYSEEF
jgi:adenylosuccinate lyase